MAKKPKKEKKKKERDPATPRQEIDAVKGFIFVMILLIVALGVFIFITNGKLGEYEDELARIKSQTRGLALKSLEVGQYLKLIGEGDETVLLNYPSRFFMNRYRTSEVNVREEQVAINRRRDTPNRREQYTEIAWPIEMTGINRRQAGLFLWGVEEKSAKARTIELRMTRDRKRAAEDIWKGTFKIGYRVAGAGGTRK
jgi:hypothetical protein